MLWRIESDKAKKFQHVIQTSWTDHAPTFLQVKEDSTGNVKIASSHAGKDFAAEEISAQVLRKLTDDAAKFLNDKVRSTFPQDMHSR